MRAPIAALLVLATALLAGCFQAQSFTRADGSFDREAYRREVQGLCRWMIVNRRNGSNNRTRDLIGPACTCAAERADYGASDEELFARVRANNDQAAERVIVQSCLADARGSGDTSGPSAAQEAAQMAQNTSRTMDEARSNAENASREAQRMIEQLR